MRFTRRRLERLSASLAVVVPLLTMSAMAASCGSSDGPEANPAEDANADAARGTDDADVPDAGQGGGLVDAAPLPVVCTSSPCAKALVTTLGTDAEDRSQGFCVLLDDGTVACWGPNGAGQLGRGDGAGSVDSPTPARVVGLSGVVALDHTCAVDGSGSVWCWGTGPFLRPDAGGATSTERTPVKLDLPPARTVGLGFMTACALVDEGVLCWGSNANGQLGPMAEAPEDSGMPRVIPISPGAPVRAMAVGKATFVLREDGALVTWGGNPPIGRVSPMFPDPQPRAIALEGISTADLAYDNACATVKGTGYCWGARGFEDLYSAETVRALPDPIFTPEPILQIATTRTRVLEKGAVEPYRWCATAVSGAVYCSGWNESGQAGDGTRTYAATPVKVEGLPAHAAQVRTTSDTTCALLTNGKVYCWGSNYHGQLGNGQVRGLSVLPTEVLLP